MMTTSNFIASLALILAVGCNNAPQEVREEPSGRGSYDMSNNDAIKFLLGRVGLQAELDRIEAGEKLGEMWTYVKIPASVLDPQTMAGTIGMNTSGIAVSHEFFAADPTTLAGEQRNFRLDFTTSAASTSGALKFDRANDGRVYLDVLYKGNSTVYSETPVYIEFGITTGFPIQK